MVLDRVPSGVGSDERVLVENLVRLPHKILKHFEVEELPQLVLHALAHEDAFSLKKATYLIDNPDFDHLIGVAGFCKDECPRHASDMWASPANFCHDMAEAMFHNRIKRFLNSSLKRKDVNLHNFCEVKELGELMGMDDPAFVVWDMKHDNHGILIFERELPLDIWQHNLLTNIAALLSMCRA